MGLVLDYYAKKAGPHKFASTQFNMPEDIAAKVLRLAEAIPDDELADDGREDEPHVTVRYGLHGDDVEEVRRIVDGIGPVRIRLGETSLFPASEGREYDVVKIDVDSRGLHRLNSLLAKLPHTDTHPEYHPHVTLAYVQPGEGEKYVGRNELTGTETTLAELLFSNHAGNKTAIPLSRQKSSQNGEVSEAYAALVSQHGETRARAIVRAGLAYAAKHHPHDTVIEDLAALLTKGQAQARVYLATPDTLASFARKSLRKIYVVDDASAVRQARALAAEQGIEVVPTDALRGGSGKDFAERSKSFLEAVQEEAEDGNTRATLLIGHADHIGQKARPGTYLRFEGRGGQWQAKSFRVKDWDEGKHPRGGDPKHPGRFSSGHGGGGGATDANTPGAANANEPTPDNRTKPYPAPTDPDKTKPASVESQGGETSHLPSIPDEGKTKLTNEHAEKLRTSPVKQQKPLSGGVNGSHVISLEDGSRAVWKPMHEENPAWNRKGIPKGSQYRREAASFHLADIAGFGDLVPPTVIRHVEDKVGSAQAFADHAKTACNVVDKKLLRLLGMKPQQTSKYDGETDLKRAAALDYLLSSSDRHDGNWMVTDAGKLVLIDNGASLPTNYDDSEYYHNRMILEETRRRDYTVPAEFAELADKWPAMEKALKSSGIEDEAIELARERLDTLVEAAKTGKKFHELPIAVSSKGEPAAIHQQSTRIES